jgi:hypothetical protein
MSLSSLLGKPKVSQIPTPAPGPTDGPGDVRITYCGYVKGVGGGPTIGMATKVLGQVENANEAKSFIIKQLNSNSIKDSFGNIIGKGTNYSLGKYKGYVQSKSQPGNYYHDFKLTSLEDSFCQAGGKKKRTTHKRRVTRRRSGRRKSNKSRSRR